MTLYHTFPDKTIIPVLDSHYPIAFNIVDPLIKEGFIHGSKPYYLQFKQIMKWLCDNMYGQFRYGIGDKYGFDIDRVHNADKVGTVYLQYIWFDSEQSLLVFRLRWGF
jgi:hypothetical protein